MENELDDQGMQDLIHLAGWDLCVANTDAGPDYYTLYTNKDHRYAAAITGYESVKEAFEGFVRLKANGHK